MTRRDDGGSAFPVMPPVSPDGLIPGGFPSEPEFGMSLRDYFAAAAIQGLVYAGLNKEDVAKRAYAIADAMIAERSK